MSESKPKWCGATWWIPGPPHGNEVYESEEAPDRDLRLVAEVVGPAGMERAVALLLREAPNLYAELEDLLDRVGAPPHDPAFAALAKARGEEAPE